MERRDNTTISPNGSLVKQEQELWLKVADQIAGVDWYEVAERYYDTYGWITIPLVLQTDGENLKAIPRVKGWSKVEVNSKEDLRALWGYTKVVELSKDEADNYGRAKKVEKKKDPNGWLTCGIALVCGQKSGVFVLDIDNIQDFEQRTGLKVEDLKKLTLYARTKSGGYHFFFQYEPSIRTAQLKGFDIKSDGGLVNLEPTTLPNKQGEIGTYKLIKDYHTEPQKAPPEVLKVLQQFTPTKEERLYNAVKTPKTRTGGFEDLQEIVEAVSKLYRAGLLNGYEDIDLAFTTGLVQLGYEDEAIKDALKVVFGEQYDEKRTEEMISRARVRLESGQELRGLGSFIYKLESLLKEHTDYRDEINKVLDFFKWKVYICKLDNGRKIRIVRTGKYGIGDDGFVYEFDRNGEPRDVGPYVEHIATLEGEDEAYELLRYKEKEFLAYLVDEDRLIKAIKAYTGEDVLRPLSYRTWLRRQNTGKRIPLYRWVGWGDEGFRHPILRPDGYFYIIEEERFITSGDTQTHWNFTKKVLTSSGLLNVLFIASFSAPVLYLAGVKRNFMVFVSGKTGTGKTTACSLACNLYYDNTEPMTLFGTTNALERILSLIRDLPILLDEYELSKDEDLLAHLVYMFSGKKGKSRSNLNLGMDQSTLRGVLFSTGEHSLEQIALQYAKRKRLGALRRTLEIRVEDKSDWGVDFDEMIEALEYIGHVGLEWIRFLEALSKAEVREVFEQAKEENKHKLVRGFETIQQVLYATTILLRRFGFDVNTTALDRYFEGVRREAQEKIENRELGWLDELMAWVNANIRDFERTKEERIQGSVVDVPVPADRYKGRIEHGELKIMKSAFESFCRERDINAGDFLKFLSKKGAIRKFGRNLYGRLKGPGDVAYHYCLYLDKVNELLGKDTDEVVEEFNLEVEELYQSLPADIRKEIERRGKHKIVLDTRDGWLVFVLHFDGRKLEYKISPFATEEEIRETAKLLVEDLRAMASGSFLEF